MAERARPAEGPAGAQGGRLREDFRLVLDMLMGPQGRLMEPAERLRCLQRLQLEPGSCLHLVEVDGRELLLASGPAGVRLLTRLPKGGTP